MKIFDKYSLLKILVILLIFATNLKGQISNAPNKAGLTTIYFDTLMKPCGSQNAQYIGYVHYAIEKTKAHSLKRSGIAREWEYKPFNDSIQLRTPTLLDGELKHYTSNEFYRTPDTYDVFKNGTQTIRIEYPKNNSNKESTVNYYDSLYKNESKTYLLYKKEKDTAIYKQYIYLFIGKKASEKTFVVAHKDYKNLNRLILGLYWNVGPEEIMKNNSRTFFELGYSKKFRRGKYVYVTKKRYDNQPGMYHAVNASMMGTTRRDDIYLGQKTTYSYTYHYLRAEAGLLNYTNLKNTDARIVGGIGASVFGNFSIMGYYSLPVVGTEFTDIGRISFGVSFH